jgi:hypothetical protein
MIKTVGPMHVKFEYGAEEKIKQNTEVEIMG